MLAAEEKGYGVPIFDFKLTRDSGMKLSSIKQGYNSLRLNWYFAVAPFIAAQGVLPDL